MQIMGFLGMYFDAVVVFVTNSFLLFRLALAILCNGSNFTRALFVGRATEALGMPLCFATFITNSKASFSTYPVPMDRIPLELFLWAELLKQYGCHCAFATWIQWCAHRRHMSYH